MKITNLADNNTILNHFVSELRDVDIHNDSMRFRNNIERISSKLSNRLNRSKLYKGDIVFPCVGSIGKATLIKEDNKYHINQNIAKITHNNKIVPELLSYLLNSNECHK